MIVRILSSVAGGALALIAGPALAQAPQTLPPPAGGAGLLQVLIGLAIVLAAIAGSAWLLRRFGPGQMAAGGALKIIGGVAVGPKERLVLVEVQDTWLVVGVAPGQVRAIHSLPRPADFRPEAVNADPGGFQSWLRQAVSRRDSAAGG